METCDKNFATIMIVILVILSVYAGYLMFSAEYETIYYTRTITMKWIESGILDDDYYFEFDNETLFLLDLHYDNPAYIYHKYEIGDTFEYNIVRQVN